SGTYRSQRRAPYWRPTKVAAMVPADWIARTAWAMMAKAPAHAKEDVLGDAVSDGRTPKGAWGITALLFLFMLINFADKTVVGLAAVPIMRDLELTPRQFGF